MDSSFQLSNYILEGEIGRGSFGIVYRVTNIKNQRTYVMKKISITHLSPKHQREALHEVEILKTLDHPHIIKYYGSSVENQVLSIVMEYADGGDL